MLTTKKALHKSVVTSVAVHPDKPEAVTVGEDGRINIFNIDKIQANPQRQIRKRNQFLNEINYYYYYYFCKLAPILPLSMQCAM